MCKIIRHFSIVPIANGTLHFFCRPGFTPNIHCGGCKHIVYVVYFGVGGAVPTKKTAFQQIFALQMIPKKFVYDLMHMECVYTIFSPDYIYCTETLSAHSRERETEREKRVNTNRLMV